MGSFRANREVAMAIIPLPDLCVPGEAFYHLPFVVQAGDTLYFLKPSLKQLLSLLWYRYVTSPYSLIESLSRAKMSKVTQNYRAWLPFGYEDSTNNTVSGTFSKIKILLFISYPLICIFQITFHFSRKDWQSWKCRISEYLTSFYIFLFSYSL